MPAVEMTLPPRKLMAELQIAVAWGMAFGALLRGAERWGASGRAQVGLRHEMGAGAAGGPGAEGQHCTAARCPGLLESPELASPAHGGCPGRGLCPGICEENSP